MIADSLFSGLKDHLIRVETFNTKTEAFTHNYLIIFTHKGYETIEFPRALAQADRKGLERYGILIEPLFKICETHQPSKNPLIRRTSIVNVVIETTGYTVKSENADIATRLQTLIDDHFASTPREKPILPQGCLQRVRKNSSNHQ